jgi:NAD-dependent dihydropyrimidine dehydrogenase PreA subunit
LATNVYERLAARLNKIPLGFPPVEDGAHLRVLQWIFTPEEAEIASQMKLRGETAEELAGRLGLQPGNLRERLEAMAKKGQIRAWDSSTGRRYALIVFIGGIWENQLKRMDKKFARLTEDYFNKCGGRGLFDAAPALFKVIPINRAIRPELEVYPFEIAEAMIKGAKSWGLRDCMCKKQRQVSGESCKYPTSVCILLSQNKEHAFDNETVTKPITIEGAIAVLRKAEEAGLIHCSMNVQQGQPYICNCCTCCCVMLRGVVKWNQPHAFLKSNFVANVDEESCIGCGKCEARCQFHALSTNDGTCKVDTGVCVGCGVCSIACQEGALGLVSRNPTERTTPPASREDWMTQKALSRGVDPSDLL